MSKDKETMFSERSMVFYKMTFNERNDPDKIIHPQDIHGTSCNALFSEFIEKNIKDLIRLRYRQ